VTHDYFVHTSEEATTAATQLKAHGHDVTVTTEARGARLTIAGTPCVDVEEVLLRCAPSVLRI
jgi:hypothetical protein